MSSSALSAQVDALHFHIRSSIPGTIDNFTEHDWRRCFQESTDARVRRGQWVVRKISHHYSSCMPLMSFNVAFMLALSLSPELGSLLPSIFAYKGGACPAQEPCSSVPVAPLATRSS